MLNFKRLKELTLDDINQMAKEARMIGCSTYRLFALEVIDKRKLESFTFDPLETNLTGNPLWVIDAPFSTAIINEKTDGLVAAELIDSSNKIICEHYLELIGKSKGKHFFIDHEKVMGFFTGHCECSFTATLIYCYKGQSEEISVFMEKHGDIFKSLPEADFLRVVLESINGALFYNQKVLN